jgi:hypothetical protein
MTARRSLAVADLPDDERRIVEAWNRRVPSQRVYRINGCRQFALRGVLNDYTAEELVQVIDHYGRRPWNLANHKWQTFDHWFTTEAVAGFYDEMRRVDEMREAAADRRRRADSEAAAEADRWRRRREAQARIAGMPRADRERLRARAAGELGAGLDAMPKMVEARMVDLLLADGVGR